MEKERCFVCFEENISLFICCHICSPVVCNKCINTMNQLYKNKCTICQTLLPMGHRKIESGNTEKMRVVNRPRIFYLETDEIPKYTFYSVKINGYVISNILKLSRYSDGKYYLINSNFPFEYFESFSILTEKKINIKSIEKDENENNPFFKDFVPELFVGSNSIVYINNVNSLKILYSHPTIYRQDFERIIRRYRRVYFKVTDNSFYRNLPNDDTAMTCCTFL